MKRALQIILVVSIGGLAFSGYLTYLELFAAGPAPTTCEPLGEPGTIAGYPPCVYGFVMYLVVATVAVVGLLRGRRRRIAIAP
jgi:uncharacterized membrane protein